MKTLSGFLRGVTGRWLDVLVGGALTGGGTLPSFPLLRGRSTLSEAVAGRTVLVTGASSGIGREVARKVAHAGARTILVARSEAALATLKLEIEQDLGRAQVYAADLSSDDAVEVLIERLRADSVEVDVLVNNAGRSIRRAVDESTDRIHDYRRTMALNYFGSVRLILALLPGMQRRGNGHVVNVSTAGVQMGTPLFSAYIASKAALDAFTRVAASELHDAGVRFTTVHMPLVRTPMIAPTEEYRSLPALDPGEAADLVLRPLTTAEAQLGTRLGGIFSLAHVLAPKAVERMVGAGHRLVTAGA